ncbi:ABC transporter permease [Aurantimonas sp. VKM B-3413]|uniref:ABC transporter permease n=1 Tax=Aurantimonas sp. VKM B-3413 TaxID=2779401 RepID=UPI001E415981|nr:ABC transporter permease [Aurantimonas sp. VKM B-3413]MCB8839901.1 ABC transporter permease [Aurantimonas sp. VKM B-3413]
MMGRTIANVLRLMGKELRSIKADPVMLILVVYSFTLAIYLVSNDASTEVRHVAVAVVDEDRSQLSRRLADAIRPPQFQAPVEIGADAVDAALNDGRFVFVLNIPPNFQADLLAGRSPELLLEIDATAMAQAGNGATDLQGIVATEIASFLSGGAQASSAPVDIVIRAWFNPNLETVWFGAVMQVMNNVTMLTLILAGAALIREREHGTVEHLLVMPVTPAQIVLSKILANGLVIVVAAALSLIFVVRWALGVPTAGSMPLFLVGTALYTITVASLGILLATFSTTMGQFGLLVIPIMVVLNLLSGGMTPLESMPDWLRLTMQVVGPSPHFVSFSQAVLYRGAGLSIVWPDLLAFAAQGAVFYALSLMRFRGVLSRI